jgi:alkanesulfonate monooxygenase SsuD/methylene tetrahydromethanopterin reductase-like flavin-dependent oxidoreductase (luciferase family)
MRIGLSCVSPDTAIAEAVLAEQRGFDYVATGEHLFFHTPSTNPFVHLAAAAGATRTIGLVSTVSLFPLYPVAIFAKQTAILDRISAGRFELGIGVGGEYPPEFEAVGVEVATRFRRVDEGLPILARLLAGETVDVQTEFTSLRGVRLSPPARDGRSLRLWVGGRGSRAARRAGRHGAVWMPYLVTPDRFRSSLAEAKQEAESCGRGRDAVSGAIFAWVNAGADGARAQRTAVETISEAYQQDMSAIADRYVIAGSAEEVTARLHEYELAGADSVIVHFAVPEAERAAAIEFFATAVQPHVQG